MLEWLREWLRPVIYQTDTTSYVQRTPTIDDVDILRRLLFKRVSATYAGGGAFYPFGVLSAADRPIQIRSMSIYQTAGGIDLAGYGISNGLILGVPTTWDELQLDGALDAYGIRQVIDSSGPVILPPGYSLYATTYDAASGARTVQIYITYVEM